MKFKLSAKQLNLQLGDFFVPKMVMFFKQEEGRAFDDKKSAISYAKLAQKNSVKVSL